METNQKKMKQGARFSKVGLGFLDSKRQIGINIKVTLVPRKIWYLTGKKQIRPMDFIGLQ